MGVTRIFGVKIGGKIYHSFLLPGEMVTSSFKHVVQEVAKSLYETKMSLTVRDFQTEDVGSYRCIAKNSLGEVESSIRLYGNLLMQSFSQSPFKFNL